MPFINIGTDNKGIQMRIGVTREREVMIFLGMMKWMSATGWAAEGTESESR
jgi:hypothetical protein